MYTLRSLLPVEAVEAHLEVVVASSRLTDEVTPVAAVPVTSFARWVIITNQSHLYLAIAGYLH